MAKQRLAIVKRAVQDSNPRRRVRSPSGYPDYPNRPLSLWTHLLLQIVGRLRGPQWGHVKEWVDAAKAGKKSWTDFSVAGPFTEAVLIGDLAIRTAKPIDWNTADMDAKGLAAAKTLVRRDYRKGFGIK